MKDKVKQRKQTAQIGEAGVHFVVSELCRKGWIALPTTRNTRGVDVIVMRPDSFDFRALQVKSSHNPVRFWPVGAAWMPSSNFIFIFVRPQKKAEGSPFEAFVVSSKRVHKERTKPQGRWPGSWHVPKDDRALHVLHNNWNSIWQ